MSTASRRRTRQRLAEITLGLKAENLDATTSGTDLEEGDGMSRPFFDNLPSKDIKHRVEKPLGSPMQSEGMADEMARATGTEAALKAAIVKVKADSALRKDPPFWVKEDIGRCQCSDCGWHPEGCSHPASFRVERRGDDITVCSDCLQPTDSHVIGD
jgi:hypothetical protein